jgi:hypothetical protein
MDEYGNWIYLTPTVLGGIATVLAAAWKFLGIENSETQQGPLDSLYAMGRRIRTVGTEAELSAIEEEIDDILKAQSKKSASGDANAVDDVTLNVAAHRPAPTRMPTFRCTPERRPSTTAPHRARRPAWQICHATERISAELLISISVFSIR